MTDTSKKVNDSINEYIGFFVPQQPEFYFFHIIPSIKFYNFVIKTNVLFTKNNTNENLNITETDKQFMKTKKKKKNKKKLLLKKIFIYDTVELSNIYKYFF